MVYFYTNQKFVHALFELILESNIKIIEAVLSVSVLDRSLDGFYFGDDYGTQMGMLIGPDIPGGSL